MAAVRLICLLLSSLICGIAAAPPKWWNPSPFRFPPIPLFRPPPFLIPPLPFVPPVDDSPPWWNPPDSGDVPPGEDPPAPPSGGGGGGGGGSCSCSCSFSSGPPPPPPTPKVIMVGGDSKWQYGFNYTDWINNNAGDIFVGDVLEFDYAAPKLKRKHTVHSLNNYLSFKTCNLSDSIMVGNELAGSGSGGYRILLGMKPTGSDPVHYFACGEGNGDHCNNGMMKFAVKPIPRDNNPH